MKPHKNEKEKNDINLPVPSKEGLISSSLKSYETAKFLWKNEFKKDLKKKIWTLEVQDSKNPHVSIFDHIPPEASPKFLADIVIETYGVRYDQIFFWREKGFFKKNGEWVGIFREDLK